MRFQEKLHQYSKEEIWEEYCGFLTLTPEEFMNIQNRLLLEQMETWCSSGIGQSILKGKYPHTIEEFREMVPLTTYEDYAPTLLSKQIAALPGPLLGHVMVFSLLNLCYAWFQDRITFPKTFCDYEAYRSYVPFLIPTPASIRRAKNTLLHAKHREDSL